MMNRFQFSFSIDASKEDRLTECLLKKLALKDGDIKDIRILKKSVDARKKPKILYNYTVSFCADYPGIGKNLLKKGAMPYKEPEEYIWPSFSEEMVRKIQEEKENHDIPGSKERPVIAGFGPAGIFAALYLARAGLCPIIIERGAEMDERIRAVEEFHKGGKLRPDTNVQFGEGGAGTFSDGKLNTGVKDKAGRNKAVLETFVRFGAPGEILYDGRAHIGTDVIRKVVVNIRQEIKSLGGEFLFQTRFVKPEIKDGKLAGIWICPSEDDFTGNCKNHSSGPEDGLDNKMHYIPCNHLILAIGHSARDTYEMLHGMNFSMEAKAFAMGFRVIHPAKFIHECQYGEGYEKNYPFLPAAYYKLAYKTQSGRNVYSFCMCPGGYVVNASSEEGRLAVNGMSNAARDGEFSNAAIVMNVTPEDFGGDDVLAGMRYQRILEEKAYVLGEGKIPVQFYKDFKKDVYSGSFGKENSLEKEDLPQKDGNSFYENIDLAGYQSALSGDFKEASLNSLFTPSMNQSFVEGMEHFNTQMKGYADLNPLIAGVESRTSAPVRILRDESFQALSAAGIYPCGEGAGYAGGITSAAMDGLKCAEALCGATGRNDEIQSD